MVILLIGCKKEGNENNSQLAEITRPYEEITIIDIHNHDAAGNKYLINKQIWDKYGIDKIVLFGNISEPSAMLTDQIAYNAYLEDTGRIIPFIAAINIHDSSCLDYIKERFEAGVYGIGEIVAASSYSPVTSNLPWKGEHTLDGYFPEIYELCAKYHKPILLHIDPPFGFPVNKLVEAAKAYPNTSFIFAHANAYNSPSNIEDILKQCNNIYIDFFPGFNAYNPESSFTLNDFVPLINAYPDRFMVSTDSGYDIGYDNAYNAIYELFSLLDKNVVVKIAGENFLKLIANKI